MTDNNFRPYSIQTLTNLPSTTPLPSPPPFRQRGAFALCEYPDPVFLLIINFLLLEYSY